MSHRLDLGEERSAAPNETGGALEKEAPEDGDDARTLPVDVDTTGRRFRSWPSAVNFSSTYEHDADDFDAPFPVLRLMKYSPQHGSISGNTNKGCVTMIVPSTNRGRSQTFQWNTGSAELRCTSEFRGVVPRRVQAIIDANAHDAGPSCATSDGMDDGVDPSFRAAVHRRVREENAEYTGVDVIWRVIKMQLEHDCQVTQPSSTSEEGLCVFFRKQVACGLFQPAPEIHGPVSKKAPPTLPLRTLIVTLTAKVLLDFLSSDPYSWAFWWRTYFSTS